MSLRRIVKLGTPLILAMVLLCGSASAAPTKIEVVVTDIPSGWQANGQEAYNQAKADFEKANPDIHIDLQFRSWGTAYLDFLITTAAAGTMPDVFQMGGNHQGPLGRAGLLLPLNDFIKNWGQFTDFPLGVRDDVTVDGKILGLPYRADVRLLQYNKRDLDEVGLNRDAPPANWNQIVAYGKKLTKQGADGKHLRDGFRWYGSEFYAPVWQAGGDFITEVNGKPIITIDSPAARDGLEFIDKLITEYQIVSRDSKAANGSKWGIEYGTASMEVRPEGHIRKLRDDSGIDLGIGPAITQKEAAELVFINKWAISSQTKNAQAAWKWIEFVSDRRRVSAIQFNTAGLPPRRSVAQLEPWASDAQYCAVFEAMAYVRPLPGAKYTSAPNIRTAIINVIKDIQAGTMSVPAAIEKAKQAITVCLSQL